MMRENFKSAQKSPIALINHSLFALKLYIEGDAV
jgi:hypothetical protein